VQLNGALPRLSRAGRLSLALLVVCVARAAVADDTTVPSFARYKPRVEDVEHKEEGNFFSGLPLVGYDTSTGLGLGLGGYFTMNGPRTSPLFAITPYRHRIFAQGYATTGGYQQHMLSYDGVYVGNSPFRIRATLMYERNTNANYFGVGEGTLGPLTFQGVAHSTYDEQTAAASAINPGGFASPAYNQYRYDKPSASLTVERDFWGGRVRALYGAIAQYFAIGTYDGQPTQGIDAAGQSAVAPSGHGWTKLGLDCAQGRVIGCNGGWNNALKAGVALDTRDFEPDPTKGFFVDATGEWSTKALGSSFDYLRLTLAARAYVSPFPKLANLVLALRLLYSVQTSAVPFFAMDTLALTEGDQNGLGGERTLRGFRQDRFVGQVAAVGNAELRWTFVHFKLLAQRFSLQIAPLFDVGRVFDKVDFQLTNWKVSGGAGLRVGWNRSTIIMFDFGASSEDVGFYIDFGMPF